MVILITDNNIRLFEVPSNEPASPARGNLGGSSAKADDGSGGIRPGDIGSSGAMRPGYSTLFAEGMWTSYLNLARKHGMRPLGHDEFMMRLKIWKEW